MTSIPTFSNFYVEAAICHILNRTANGEPLFQRDADGMPALMRQDILSLRHSGHGFWKYLRRWLKTKDNIELQQTLFSRSIANRLAFRYPDREFKPRPPTPIVYGVRMSKRRERKLRRLFVKLAWRK